MLWADEIYPLGPMKQSYRVTNCISGQNVQWHHAFSLAFVLPILNKILSTNHKFICFSKLLSYRWDPTLKAEMWWSHIGSQEIYIVAMNFTHWPWEIWKWFCRCIFQTHFYPRPVLAFGYCRCLRVCVCVCVCLSVNHQLVRAVTHQPFKLESPNLDQRCKRPWLRSLLFF